jgi:ligand-binding SRPBCC domain-containing protein
VTWRAWHFGLPIHMTSRIVEMESPNHFVDEQGRGPFHRFRHIHEFSHHDGVTIMVDRIQFTAPLGPLGRLVEKLVLERYLKKLIKTRNSFLVERLE